MSYYDIFMQPFERGGIVMWIILGVSIVSWTVGFDRLFLILKLQRTRSQFYKALEKGLQKEFKSSVIQYNALYKYLTDKSQKVDKHVFREFLIFTQSDLNKGFSTLTVWISTALLLGLLGTVVGMIETFDIITRFGVGNPAFMAKGISVSLLTTQAGLMVSFPAMIFHVWLKNRKNSFMHLAKKECEELFNKYQRA